MLEIGIFLISYKCDINSVDFVEMTYFSENGRETYYLIRKLCLDRRPNLGNDTDHASLIKIIVKKSLILCCNL